MTCSDVTSTEGVMTKMLLATAYIDGHIDDREAEVIINIVKRFDSINEEEIGKIIKGFDGLDAKGVIEYISPEINAIGEVAGENLKEHILVGMRLVSMADGEEHDNEHILIKACVAAWSSKHS